MIKYFFIAVILFFLGFRYSYYIKLRYQVIRFLDLFNQAEESYIFFDALINGRYENLQSELSKEEFDEFRNSISKPAFESLKELVEETIEYYDTTLKEFGIPEIDSRAEKLSEMGTEIRRWLWNNS